MPANDSKFHYTDYQAGKYAENIMGRALKAGQITTDDEKLIREYVDDIASYTQISQGRVMKLYYVLCGWRRFIGPFRENTIVDIKAGLRKVEVARKDDGTPWKKNTIIDYRHFIKRFYKWLIGKGYSKIDIQEIYKIRSGRYDSMTKTAGMLLTDEEVKAMIENAGTSRNRAFISALYEGGFRVGELGNLRWQQVEINDWNVSINVNNKTEVPRFVPLVMAQAYLKAWKADYPGDPIGENYVFLTEQKNQMQYNGVKKMLKTVAEKAKVSRKITPHLFRHSRITHLKQQGFDDTHIKLMLWGNVNTDQYKTYMHLTNDDILKAVAVHAGITQPEIEVKEDVLEARQCPKCHAVNGPTHKYCPECGEALTRAAMKDKQEDMTVLLEDISSPEYHAEKERLKQVELENRIAELEKKLNSLSAK